MLPQFVRGQRLAIGILILLVLGVSLRFRHIERNSLWVDELFTAGVALYHPLVPESGKPWYRPINVQQIADGDSFLTVKLGEQSPPLHDLLAKASIQSLGPTELAARLPAALAACLLLVVCAWLAWRERDPWMRRVLCWTLLLLAFYPVLVVYAKDGRAYSLGASLVGIGALQWMLRWWRGRSAAWQPPSWPEAISLALACMTHYNAVPIVSLLMLPDLVMAIRKRSGAAWLRFGAMALIVLPWIGLHMRTILFTAEGGVAWGSRPAFAYVEETLRGTLNILHPPWLILVFLALLVSLGWTGVPGWREGAHPLRKMLRSPKVKALGILALLAAGEVAAAGFIAAKAGMANPRYYIFMIPLAAVALAIVLAQLRPLWMRWLAGAGLVALALPFMRPPWMPLEDFRGASHFAFQYLGPRTPVLFPFEPNRMIYRVYLDRYFGASSDARMISTSSAQDAERACDRLSGESHVAVVGHDAHKHRTEEVYAACGQRWPYRYTQQFHNTYAEHWLAEGPLKRRPTDP